MKTTSTNLLSINCTLSIEPFSLTFIETRKDIENRVEASNFLVGRNTTNVTDFKYNI